MVNVKLLRTEITDSCTYPIYNFPCSQTDYLISNILVISEIFFTKTRMMYNFIGLSFRQPLILTCTYRRVLLYMLWSKALFTPAGLNYEIKVPNYPELEILCVHSNISILVVLVQIWNSMFTHLQVHVRFKAGSH